MNAVLVTTAGVAFAALCGLAGVLGASWISKRSSDRAQQFQAQVNERNRVTQERIDERKVDREEFDSLRSELRQQLVDVKVELGEERAARAASDERARLAEERAAAADERAAFAESRAEHLELRVEQLEETLRARGLDVPPTG